MELATLILNLILQCFKVFWFIVGKWEEWNQIEKDMFTKRMQTWGDTFTSIIENQKETYDEDAYLKTLEAEKKTRFTIYKSKIQEIIISGNGLSQILGCTLACMNVRANLIKNDILNILISNYSIEGKVKMITKILVEVELG
jgi:hypothetical protein